MRTCSIAIQRLGRIHRRHSRSSPDARVIRQALPGNGGIFPSLYQHGGCDEVNWADQPCRASIAGQSRAQIWAEYLNALNQSAQKLGKQFIVWGDLVLHKDPQISRCSAKDIIIMDWNYTDTSSTKVHDGLASIRANGSRAIGAPALINYQWGPRAGARQLRNVDALPTRTSPRQIPVPSA